MAADDDFLQAVHAYYTAHGRHDLPWRQPEAGGSFDPYKILVSEVMLQQTQAPRVIPKYHEFLRQFPTVQILAAVSLGQVLVAWQGLGYNRRAKFLWQAAQRVVANYAGQLPHNQKELGQLPGIGPNTAGAILAYAFNEPAVFIETNIRTVYIHHFFSDQTAVPDAPIRERLRETLLMLGKGSDELSYREFYWALMDYGSYLKQSVGNLSRASKSYAKQPAFHGSLRQLRGRAIRLLSDGPLSKAAILSVLNDERAISALRTLEREGLVQKAGNRYRLP